MRSFVIAFVLPGAVVAAAVLDGVTQNSAAGDGGSYNYSISCVQIPPEFCANELDLQHSFRKAAIALPPK
jgi:hypothetical protein